jgi:NADH:ubiquinone oxidoreductase subunit 5 (subunit L)/multisubunit Na+/H+ antiporter MnhA subunit
VISFLLIGFWQRSEAQSSSLSAVMYNRAGDFFLMLLVIGSGGN